jgi:NADPH:quinone reductase-like Zn-dependent oxidoreductase
MKAMQFEQQGPPEVMVLVDLPEPHAGPGEIRIRVHAAGVNPVDWKIRGGSTLRATPIPLPSVPGLEAAGVVDELGPEVEGVSLGDEVFGSALGGAAAEFTRLDQWELKPAGMSWAEAAGLPMAVETAARGLDTLGLAAGQTLLVSGAAGGVGTAAVQLAIARGAFVIGTGGPDSQDYIAGLGATAIGYGPDLPARVAAIAPQGVDLALDVAGHGVIPDLIAITGRPEAVVGIGDALGATAAGIQFTTGSEGRAFHALATAADLFTQGQFRMPVDQTYALIDLPLAHHVSEAGHVRGKLVVVID